MVLRRPALAGESNHYQLIIISKVTVQETVHQSRGQQCPGQFKSSQRLCMSSVIISFPSVRREPGFRPGLRLGEGTMHVIHLIFQGFLLSVHVWTLEVSVVVWPSPLLHRGRGEPSDNPHYSSPGCKDLNKTSLLLSSSVCPAASLEVVPRGSPV